MPEDGRPLAKKEKEKLTEMKENTKLEKKLRAEVVSAALKHYAVKHGQKKVFSPGNKIPYGGRVFDGKEIENLIDASLDFWLTTGKYSDKFEKDFSKFLGVKYCSLVNSGSSANLLAFMALTSPKLGEKRIKKEDEVITVAAGFPTTVTPIIQFGAVPVFIDIKLPTYDIDCSLLDRAISVRTKAVMLAHTLGNPFDLEKVKNFCAKNRLWLIEDNCDALGTKYQHAGKWKYTGTFGDIGTSSFYPPHHMTMGEGGAVYTNDPLLKQLVDSFRDWGKDCWCPSGKDNICKNRFNWKLGDLPHGYDHKYIYSHFGYNLKATDLQAAIGCAQLKKLPGFIVARKRNWLLLREGLDGLTQKLILPEATAKSDPSWFGFLITVKESSGLSRDAIVRHLEKNGIQTRMLFAGNLLKHPCFDDMRKTGKGYRVAGHLKVTDEVMNRTFWVGVYPGLSIAEIKFMIAKIKEAVA